MKAAKGKLLSCVDEVVGLTVAEACTKEFRFQGKGFGITSNRLRAAIAKKYLRVTPPVLHRATVVTKPMVRGR
jgi:hypothetical protein